ncbi:DUF1329 domain-containing protein [Pseudomonas sp. GD03860]|uniref:DUF1329 domain-containing protein n=1 Tax=Pseudomonas TaxID=286 RepID=UPI002364897B|nr:MULTISPECIES: DUF1329 domain-containing protein [Pseudomonas]MDD2058497.1 DUF1329 domain-containing protein [Pseudomonas putida]MDH0640831.1 DUF1329 domain-containing protein [Pseudomonas sp. GD03860]
MNASHKVLFASLLSLYGSLALAAPDYSQLGKTLTAFGAQQSGNEDGSIPPYTGGLAAAPAGFDKNSHVRPDPFANEKPLLSINQGNVDQYASKLTAGTVALIKRYPSFRVDVYPTHRTAAFPQWVQDNAIKNAGKAKLDAGGTSVSGVHATTPFPIAQNGNEAMWNMLMRYNGDTMDFRKFTAFNVTSAGQLTISTQGRFLVESEYYNDAKQGSSLLQRTRADYVGPARRAGEAVMILEPANYEEAERRAYQYLPGQRRVKLAPDLAYDTPNTSTSGMSTMDDVGLFNGKQDRFDFKLVGKKEMYVPYNAYRMVYASKPEEVFKANHINPDYVRWELHRVWVVEATLKPGARHIYKKREFYLDEDSWAPLAVDQYDARDSLWRVGFNYPTQSYDAQTFTSFTAGHYDLIGGNYYINLWPGRDGLRIAAEHQPDNFWSPDSLAGSGIR